MKKLKENIVSLAAEIIRNNGFFLIEANVRGNDRNPIIEIYVDGLNNVTAEDCALLSRELEPAIETIEGLSASYRLDVSSPGVDRPLLFIEQYPKHVNRKFEIEYSANEETKTIKAKLISINNDVLTFEADKKETLNIIFNNIKKAKVIVSFS